MLTETGGTACGTPRGPRRRPTLPAIARRPAARGASARLRYQHPFRCSRGRCPGSPLNLMVSTGRQSRSSSYSVNRRPVRRRGQPGRIFIRRAGADDLAAQRFQGHLCHCCVYRYGRSSARGSTLRCGGGVRSCTSPVGRTGAQESRTACRFYELPQVNGWAAPYSRPARFSPAYGLVGWLYSRESPGAWLCVMRLVALVS